MFNEHRIMSENQEPVLYLFTQSFDVCQQLVKGIFEHIHEDVLLDWAFDYMEKYDVSYGGNTLKVVSGATIVRDLKYPYHMRRQQPIAKNKILPFRN